MITMLILVLLQENSYTYPPVFQILKNINICRFSDIDITVFGTPGHNVKYSTNLCKPSRKKLEKRGDISFEYRIFDITKIKIFWCFNVFDFWPCRLQEWKLLATFCIKRYFSQKYFPQMLSTSV